MGIFAEISINDMGKGDIKTRKGKIFNGTYGVRRKRKQKKNSFYAKNVQKLNSIDAKNKSLRVARASVSSNHEKGVEGEQIVNGLASKAYLKYWCYPNPIDEEGDKKEICDLLIAFFDTAIIISVKNYDNKGDYERYKRKVVEKSTNQLFGAERKLFKSNRNIKITHHERGEFIFKPSDYKHLHRITVNVGEQFEKYEFIDTKENKGCINIFNQESFEAITDELDTIKDLIEYLSIRETLFLKNNGIQMHCSEKDLLAYYLMNNREFPQECFNGNFEEWSKSCIGKWDTYLYSRSVLLKKLADEKSYFIDELIKNDALPLEHGELFAKELMTLDRFERRNIASDLFEVVIKYQTIPDCLARRHYIINDILFLFVYYPPNKTEEEKDLILQKAQEIYAYKFNPNKVLLLAATNNMQQWKFGLFETQKAEPTEKQKKYYDIMIKKFGWFKELQEIHKENKEYPDEQ
ncbi:MAG: 30S ribosomal protein THX [Paludibacter sp.]|nr:30S ribosomal protein THX [Paludibacter sp.]